MKVLLRICACFVLAAALPIFSATLESLNAAAAATRAKHAKTALSWTTLCKTREVTVELQIAEGADHRKIDFTVIGAGGKRVPACSLTIVSDLWYLKLPGGKTAQYRAYEAPLPMGVFYNLLDLSKLHYADREVLEGAEILGVTDGIAEVSLKKGAKFDATLKSLQAILARAEQDPDIIQSPRASDVQGKIKRLNERGLLFKVGEQAGLLLETGAPDTALVQFSGFRWLDALPVELEKDVIDQTKTVKGIGSTNIIMAARRAPVAANLRDNDAFIVDFDNKDFRRIASRNGAAEPGCFLPDRKSVLVHVRNLSEGGAHPYIVNLETGANTRFGPDEFHQLGSSTSAGALSPNEKQIALIHQPNIVSFDRQQIRIVNIDSSRVRTLGPDGVYREALWLFSGDGLVLERLRPEADPKKPYYPEVGLLSLDGSFQSFGRGRNPAIISRDRVVFFSAVDEKWMVVDKDGGNKKVFHEKLDATYRGPAVNPSRLYMLLVKYDKTGPESANILNIHNGDMGQLKFPPGDWANIVWGR